MQGMQLNLIILIWCWIVLKIFLSYKLLETEKNLFLFLFLNLEFYFSMTRGSARVIANPYAISYCSKLWKNLTSCAFPSGKACKKYLEFPANQKFARIILLRLNFRGRSRLGTRLVVIFYDVHASPCVQRLGVNTPCHADAWPGFGYNAILCLFWWVEHGSLLGWSISITG